MFTERSRHTLLILAAFFCLVLEEDLPDACFPEISESRALGRTHDMPSRWDPIFVRIDDRTQWECGALDACRNNTRIWTIVTPYGKVVWANTTCRSGVATTEFPGSLAIIRLPN